MNETIPAIRKSLDVPLSPEDAFRQFTTGMREWWPLDVHSLSASEGKVALDVTVEPRVGGRVVETRYDGGRAEWATVTQWHPGRLFAVDWYVGRAPDQATHYDVTFTDRHGGSLIALVHSGFERLGAAGEAAAANYDEGWDFVLGECFRLRCLR